MKKYISILLFILCLPTFGQDVFIIPFKGTTFTTLLTDNFNDNSIDGAKWVDVSAGVAETNSELELTTIQAGGNVSCGAGVYNLTGSAITFKIVDIGNLSLASYVFSIQINKSDWSASFEYKISGTNLIAYNGGGSATATWNATTMQYLRIKEASGKTYWDYSSDGASWTNLYNVNNPFAITSIIPYIKITSSSEASTTTAKIDDFNFISYP